MYYSKKEYDFIGFEKSKTVGKKYDAILKNKKDGKEVRVPYGARGYTHYRDSTGLGLYSKFDHNDKKRRELYRARHKVFLREGYYSPGFFSMVYLW